MVDLSLVRTNSLARQRKSYARIPNVLEVPNLIQI